ncbi:glycosyltransferase [Candidatus Parcubacteria bacterium]|nr:glycosyltransferase [Candidatus Parcubacteria bacterium]
MKKLSVIIINYGTTAMTEKVIRNFIVKEKSLDYEIILIDNKSSEKINEKIFLDLGVELIKNQKNLGFAKAVNQGIKSAKGEYVLLLNSDVFIKDRAISNMIEYLENNLDAAIIGPKMFFPDKKAQINAGRFPNLSREFLRLFKLYNLISKSTLMSKKEMAIFDACEVDWLSGGCMLFKRELIKQIGFFDERYFLGVEDIDFCYRARLEGYKNIYYPISEVIHYHGYSSGGTASIKRIKYDRDGMTRFMRKHFPKKVLSCVLIRLMHNLKIFYLYKIKSSISQKKYTPKDATIAVTYLCNSRCTMCNIWQDKNPQSLSKNDFYNLSPNLKYINLSGGEPFLHLELPEIVRIINKVSPKAKIIISSNGLATDLIIKTMKEIKKIDSRVGIRISIDGMKKTHDSMRGVNGIYEYAIKTVYRLKKINIKNLGLSFTIMNENAAELKDVYNLSKDLQIELALALVQNSEIYFTKNDNQLTYIDMVKDGLNYIIKQELKSANPKRWGRAFYNYGLLKYAEKGERLLKSGAAYDSLFIEPSGNVYPSNLINLKLGNIKKDNLNNIWQSGKARAVREKIEKENITESWIICTIRGEMKKNVFKVLFWVMKNKKI